MATNELAAPETIGAKISLKIGKPTWFILGAGVFIILVITMLVLRNQQSVELKNLSQDLATAKTRLEALHIDQLDIQHSQLMVQNNLAAAQLDNVKNQVMVDIDSITSSERLYTIAKESSVIISDIRGGTQTAGKLGGIAVTVYPVTVTAKGDWLALVDFISRLKVEFTTSLVDRAQIDVSADPGKTPSTASIEYSVYTYKGN
jgi:hypothetical protein